VYNLIELMYNMIMSESDDIKARAAILIEEMKRNGKYLMNKNFKFKNSRETNVAETIRLAQDQLVKAKRRARRAKV
jgi:hypothetical protein